MSRAYKKMRRAYKNLGRGYKKMSSAYKNFCNGTLLGRFFKKNFWKLEYAATILAMKTNVSCFFGFAYFFNLFYVNLFAKSQ